MELFHTLPFVLKTSSKITSQKNVSSAGTFAYCGLPDPQTAINANFRLWGHLKHLVSRDNPRTLPVLQDNISRHVLSISQNTLRSTVEHDSRS
ncbi:hypothetical protein AVEN_144856-1 [Araneus ventricosus]|uniref:Uncharacterized protein n=1 Tax=Araneus ventricosus TaxID=182803 RepID=A0A4Y1ZQ62_ARAVE|nr:hypothetical protein AVEN_20124-1 [Araneus ventricosus]GBN53429.1 hypothetical protein AVEN_144856-1 [Araneus ventricosus]